MEKIVLTGCLPQEITEKLELNQSFRGKQIFKWVSTGVTDFDSMTNAEITDDNDMGIDCYVWHEDTKDLYINQNKHYSAGTKVDANYVSTAISTELNKLEGTHREIVNSLPESGDTSIIYLVPANNGTDNSYDEFMWVKVGDDYRFEKIGSTSVDTSMASDQEVEDLLETIFS